MKSFIANSLLVLGLVVACLFSLEGLTRLILDDGMLYELEMWKYAREVKVRDMNPELGHRHRPNADSHLMGVHVRTDSRGFRSAEIPDRTPDGTARIAFVGDSTTMGWGVAERDLFSEQILEALRASGRKVDGYNTGVGNHNTLQELTLFRETGATLKPDIVVLSYFINDAEPVPAYNAVGWLDRHSAFWVVLNYRLDALSRQFGEAPDWKKYYRELYNDNAAGWAQTRRALAGFETTAKDIGAQLVVFNLPELREFKPYPFQDVTDKVRADVEKLGVPFVDLLPAVQNMEPSSLWVTVPDPHPNAKAATAFAKGMLPELSKMLDKLCEEKGKGCKP